MKTTDPRHLRKGTPEYEHYYRTGQKNDRGETICGSKKRNKFERCGTTKLLSNGRCRLHGGKTPSGIASPHFRTGRYSKDLPSGLMEIYEEALQDKELTSLDDEIILMRTRIKQLIRRTDTGLSARFILDLRKLWGQMSRAMQKQDAEATQTAMDDLDDLIRVGYADYAIWDDINQSLGRLLSLVNSKRKHEIDSQRMIEIRQLAGLFAGLQVILLEELGDNRETLERIAVRIRTLQSQSQLTEVIEGEYRES